MGRLILKRSAKTPHPSENKINATDRMADKAPI
jgi:hypothetical protein